MNEMVEMVIRGWNTLPSWGQAIPLLLCGYLMALVLRWLVSLILGLLKFDRVGEQTGISEFLRKGKVSYTPSKLLGLFVFWMILGLIFLKAARMIDVDIAIALSSRVREIIPGLFTAALFCALGMVLVWFIGNLAGTIARNAGYSHADLLVQLVKWTGGLLVLAVSLEQISFGKTLLTPLILIFFAALALGAALAFGLGCKDLARDLMLRVLAALRERHRAEKSDLEG